LFVLDVPPSSTQKRSVFDLAERGQAAYLSEHKSLDEVRADLTPKSPKPAIIDHSKTTRRLVANLVHRALKSKCSKIDKTKCHDRWLPADRIVWSEIVISIESSTGHNFEFESYDKINTGYEIVDLGKLSRTVDWNFTGASSAAAGIGGGEGDVGSLEFGGSAEGSVGQSLYEEIQLQRRIVTESVAIEAAGKRMRIIREGATGIDLTGAVYVDTKLAITDAAPVRLYSLTPKPTPTLLAPPATPGSTGPACTPTLAVTFQELLLAPPAADTGAAPKLELKISGGSIIRSVDARGHTIRESDDRVHFEWSNADEQTVAIEYEAVVAYRLVGPKGIVQIRRQGQERGDTLQFESSDQAMALMQLLAHPQGFTAATCGYELVDETGHPYPLDGITVEGDAVGYRG
jgi:hypothetical protein